MHAENCPHKLKEDYLPFIEGASFPNDSDPFKEWEEFEKEFMPSESTYVQVPKDPLKKPLREGVFISEYDFLINNIINDFSESLEKTNLRGYFFAKIIKDNKDEFVGLHIFESKSPNELIYDIKHALILEKHAITHSQTESEWIKAPLEIEIMISRRIPVLVLENGYVFLTKPVTAWFRGIKDTGSFFKIYNIRELLIKLTKLLRDCKGNTKSMLIINLNNNNIRAVPRTEIEEFIDSLQKDAQNYVDGYRDSD